MFKSTALQVILKSGNHNIQWEDVKEFMWFTVVMSVKRCQEYDKITIASLKHRDCQQKGSIPWN
jgi:hypothetical protein